jgi:hypothetical protein
MESIINNPFRILGLEANFKASALQANLNKIRAYTIAETLDELVFDFDFPILGSLKRNEESINQARASINFPNDKIKHALFWFYKGSSNDLPAFDCLKDGDFNEAIENWKKVTSSEISERNFSAYFNLSTLYFFKSLENGSVKKDLFADALILKLKFLESEYVKTFCNNVADSTFKKSKEDIQLLFIEFVNQNFVQKGKIAISDIIEILNSLSFSSKASALKLFIQEPINKIESHIEQSKTNRKSNPSSANIIGKQLFQNTQKELLAVKTVLGKQDLKYGSIADKLADEILQCGIDFINCNQEKGKNADSIEIAFNLAKQADNIAVGNHIRGRIKDTIATLEELKDIELQVAIQVLRSIKDAYETNKAQITAKVKQQEKTDIAIILGQASINWSKVNQLIENSINWDKAIELVQQVIPQSNIEKIRISKNQASLNEYKNLVNFLFSKLTYTSQNKVKYLNFWDVQKTTSPSSTSKSSYKPSTTTSSPKGSSGCYIATMVYGSYEHPQVLVLRGFRDNVLNNYSLGRKFINFYYKHSPYWVEKMKNNKTLNKAIKIILNSIIKLLK